MEKRFNERETDVSSEPSAFLLILTQGKKRLENGSPETTATVQADTTVKGNNALNVR